MKRDDLFLGHILEEIAFLRRTLIGRIDKETGEIVPTYGRNRKAKDDTIPVKKVSKEAVTTQRSFYGGTYLLDAIGEKPDLTIPSEVVSLMKIHPGDLFRITVIEESGTLVLRCQLPPNGGNMPPGSGTRRLHYNLCEGCQFKSRPIRTCRSPPLSCYPNHSIS